MKINKIILWAYIACILIFALIYYYIGHESFNNMREHSFIDCVYFSAVTMSSCGYGDITPNTSTTKLLCTVQSIVVIMCTAAILFPDVVVNI